MNVFEDLIEELKEENLLESTVIEINKPENYYDARQPQLKHTSLQKETNPLPEQKVNEPISVAEEVIITQPELYDTEISEIPVVETPEINASKNESVTTSESDTFEVPSESAVLNNLSFESPEFETEKLVESLIQDSSSYSEQVIQVEAELKSLQELQTRKMGDDEEKIEAVQNQEVQPLGEPDLENEQPEFPEYELLSKSVVEDSQFYRRRANEEVTSLQIVEHIISAIEKEQMKIVPQSYDDLAVSMALHDFLQAGNNPLSDEHTQAEFKLMQETEKWYSALASRDKNITVGDLRRYCEKAKPALSSQALISLARFYRNSPFSEIVRSKFDMVVTKLVTKESWDDTRLMIFNRDELVKQLEELYADWSSIPLYEHKEEDSDVLIGVLKFEDFILEINNADSLDELIKNDFFNRVRLFKETTNEKFFAPLLASAAIECNVIVGNKFVQLVALEKETHKESEIEEKYNLQFDQPVSDTVSKTIKLVELLKEKKEAPKPAPVEQPKEIKETLKAVKSSNQIIAENFKKNKPSRLKVNKITVAVITLSLIAFGTLYSWAEFMTPQLKPSPSVRKVSLENTSLREYFKTARINRETFFAVTEPAWEKLSNEVKGDILKKTLAEGKDSGYNKIHVINSEGKTLAFASETGINLQP